MRLIREMAAGRTINLIEVDLESLTKSRLGIEIGHHLHVDTTADAATFAARAG